VHRNVTRPQAVQAFQHVLTFECQRKAQLSAVNLLSRVRSVALAEHEQNLLVIAAHQTRHSRQAASGLGCVETVDFGPLQTARREPT